MPDPQTPNLGLFVPLNGADVNTWDVPMNANFNLLDSLLGGNAGVVLNNLPVTLSPAQYGNAVIRFTGTLTADVTVTMPPVGRLYTLVNNCGSATTFNVTIACSTPTTYVCLPPNEPVTVLTVNGTDVAYVNLGHCGEYWDFAGTTVPRWVTGSNPVPYLNCDGTAFSSATYPNLRDYLGTNVLPDARGRYRIVLNQGTARMNNPTFTADAFLAGGGTQVIAQTNLPSYNLPVTDPQHNHGPSGAADFMVGNGGLFTFAAGADLTMFVTNALGGTTADAGTGITVGSGGSGFGYTPPTYVGGITMIRAA